MTQEHFIDQINSHQGLVKKICNIYGEDPDDKQDLFQEILLQAWKSASNFKGESTFSTWLYRVSINTALAWQKQIKKRWAFAQESKAHPVAFAPDDGQEEHYAAMHRAIEKLGKIDKALVALYLEDLDYKTIGEILGISANNVAVKLTRIRATLKQTMLEQQ